LSGRNACRYIVCNADEGDPGAYSDRYLLEQQCLKVVFGMVAAAYCINSDQGVIYIRAEYPESIRNTLDIIEELLGNSWLGENICGSDFSFSLKVIRGAGAYICGEETSLLASIEGRRPEVEVRPPFPAVRGLYQQPTVVNNVESFAALPAILQMGGGAFAALGTTRSTGTKLLSLDSHFNKPGIYEVQMGFPLTKLIEAAGGFRVPVKALHIGGPLGGLVPMSKVQELTIDFESFSSAGFLLGHAGVISIPDDFPMIDYLAHLFEFTANESCGKCFPCRLGSVRGHEMLMSARDDGQQINRGLLEDLLETMELGSLCALGGGLPLPIRNALAYFEDELREYFSNEIQEPDREPHSR
jgi:NADH-quinone oxidoreductase subunit F